MREEFARREMLLNREKKDLEGSMLVEISELEKKNEQQLQEAKSQHDKEMVGGCLLGVDA